MPPTIPGSALRRVAAPLVVVALSVSAVAAPTVAAPAPAPASSTVAPKGVQLQTTLRHLLADAQKIADARTGPTAGTITRADFAAALSTLGQRSWEQGFDFRIVDTYSGDLADISVHFAPDGTIGVALGNPGGGNSCALARLAPGSKKATDWSFDTGLGKNCSGKTAAAGQTKTPPAYLDPIPPADLAGVTVTGLESALTIDWPASPAADLDHYNVYLDGVKVGTTKQTSWIASDLINYRPYQVTVTAVDATDNESEPSKPVTGMPVDLTAPDAPTGLSATSGEGLIALTWDTSAAADLDHYVVYSDGIPVATTTEAAYTVTGLDNYVDHDYRVAAVDVHGNTSTLSDNLAAHAVDLTAPGIPTGLAADPGDGQVALTWDAVDAADLDHYVIYSDGQPIGTSRDGAFTVTGLENYVEHVYQVAAVDTHGNESKAGNPVTAQSVDLTAPDAPTGLAGQRGDGEVKLTWNASAADDLDHYNVYVDGTKVAETTDPAHLVDCLVNYVDHDFTVTAVDVHGNESKASDPLTAGSVDLTAPDAPTGLRGEAGTGQVTLTWTAPTADDVDHYNITDGAGNVLATIPAGTTTTTLTDLLAGTDYSFAVIAVDTHGNASDPTPTITVTLPAATTGVPVNEDVWSPVKGDRYGTPILGAEVDKVSGNGGVMSHASATASSDGRYVVFGTQARLEPSDTNRVYELYLMDRQTDTARRLFPTDNAKIDKFFPEPTNPDNLNYAWNRISGNGKYLLIATNQAKVPGDTNYANDLYRYDLTTGEWRLATAPSSGQTGTQAGLSIPPAYQSVEAKYAGDITADGRYVFFSSERTGLVTSGYGNLYRKDLETGQVIRVTTTRGDRPVVTPDGKWMFFRDDQANRYLTRTEVATGATTPVVVRGGSGWIATIIVAETYGDEGAPPVSVSADGRYAMVLAQNSLTSVKQAAARAYRIDVENNTATAANPDTVAGPNNQTPHTNAVIDPTGRYGYFGSPLDESTNTRRGGGTATVYRTDFATGEVKLLSTDGSGQYADGHFNQQTLEEYQSYVTAVFPDGNVLIETAAPLVSSDYNGTTDLFVKDPATEFVTSLLPGETYDVSTASKFLTPGNNVAQVVATDDGGTVSMVSLPARGKLAHTIFGHRILTDRFPGVVPNYVSLMVKSGSDGKVEWLAPMASQGKMTTLPGGDVLVASGKDQISRYDGRTGTVKWTTPLTGTETIAVNQTVYDTNTGRVYAIGTTSTAVADLDKPLTYQIGASTLTRGTSGKYPNNSRSILAVALDGATGAPISAKKLTDQRTGYGATATGVALSPAGDVFAAFQMGGHMSGMTEDVTIADMGQTYTTSDGSKDAFVVKVDGDLSTVRASVRINATATKEARIEDLVVTASGDVLVSGWGNGSTQVGTRTVAPTSPVTSSSRAGFLARLDSSTLAIGNVATAVGLYDPSRSASGTVWLNQIGVLPNGHVVVGYQGDYGFTVAAPGDVSRSVKMTGIKSDPGLLEYDPSTGKFVAASRYGTGGQESLTSSSVRADGTVQLGGVIWAGSTAKAAPWTYSANQPPLVLPTEEIYEGTAGYSITVPSPAEETDSRFRLF